MVQVPYRVVRTGTGTIRYRYDFDTVPFFRYPYSSLIITDHFSLKYLLDQRVTTTFQAKWLPKLLNLDYEISYKKRSENAAADALSRIPGNGEGSQMLSLIATTISSPLWEKIKDNREQDMVLKNLIQKLERQTSGDNKYTWSNGQLRRKEKLMVGNVDQLRKQLFLHFHGDSVGGHSGVQKQKPDLSAYPGLIQPLPIPDAIWSEIFMDFIEGLPKSQVAQLFLDNVYKLHGLPSNIVSDRDKVFLSNFWKSLFKMLKVQLRMSTAYHPQTDGQSEVVNKCLECYLRCMTGEKPKEWMQWLSPAEFWYNTNFHTAINITPFEVVNGQKPLVHLPYQAGESTVEEVDRSMQDREQALNMLKFHLKRAQDRMVSLANKSKTDRSFEVGTWVFLKLQPHRQVTVRQGQYHKLSSKYFRPFQIIEKIGKVAYKLQLPNHSLIHPVFHVSQQKECKGDVSNMGELSVCDKDGQLTAVLEAILDRRLGKVNNKPEVFVLVQWSNRDKTEATWERYDDLLARFPQFDAEVA
ncbi:retrotransposon-related protein [Tanacetum coccineum]